MYAWGMIWILLETLLVVLGVFFFNRYLRKGIEEDLSHQDPLTRIYLETEDEAEEPEVAPAKGKTGAKKLPN